MRPCHFFPRRDTDTEFISYSFPWQIYPLPWLPMIVKIIEKKEIPVIKQGVRPVAEKTFSNKRKLSDKNEKKTFHK